MGAGFSYMPASWAVMAVMPFYGESVGSGDVCFIHETWWARWPPGGIGSLL